MKKIFAKLAIFTILSIILAMPVQAFTDEFVENDCITADEKKEYIITIIEEAFGNPTGDITKGYASRTCYRVTNIENNVYAKPSLTETRPTACTIEEEPDPDNPGKKIVNGNICNEVMVILSKGGTAMIEGYIASIYTWAASLVGLIAVTVIIISGIQIAASGGDSQAVDSAKTRIIKSISGLAVLFLSGLILYTINPNFFTK